MNEKNKLIFKNIIAIVTAFILTFALACLNICLSGKIISNSNFAKRIIASSNYVSNAVTEITEDLCDLAIPSGLPADFFDTKVSDSQVLELVVSAIEHNFNNNTETPDFSHIKETILNEITAYANENFVVIDDETKAAIKTLSDECYNVYLRYCNPTIIQYLGRTVGLLSKVVNLGIIASFLLLGFTLIFLYKLVDIKNFFFYSFVSFMGAGLLSGVIPLILLITNKISHIAIVSKTLYGFICSFVNGSLFIVLSFSLLFVIVSLFMLFLELRKK